MCWVTSKPLSRAQGCALCSPERAGMSCIRVLITRSVWSRRPRRTGERRPGAAQHIRNAAYLFLEPRDNRLFIHRRGHADGQTPEESDS
ncbi:hypothetical protein ALP36_102278 [Pseudomonas syringae pv. coriandricola]|uniref:Uncharacterized protein n=1 Tax=Pseudomonas syringae pv. coriandricola TaxID=264453 RepID=A0A3M5RPV2_9PSED|nr:hypothetical protein ALP87_102197 [Pseudomonas syringae pv. coriandricola]RMU10544.1 hypothetical protein ALP36_102278 [Pseudomonas syringae pv. coriandricola]